MKERLNAKAVEILDDYYKQGLTVRQIVQAVMDSDEDGILKYAEYMEVINALANGYEAKAAPEVVIRQYYDRAKNDAWEADEAEDEYTLHAEQTRKEAVEFVLNELGVKIAGINEGWSY